MSDLYKLKILLKEKKESHSIKTIIDSLGSKGLALALLLFSLPFAFPITIPGLSSPFGVILILIGYRYMLSRSLWLPKKIALKQVDQKHLHTLVNIVEKFLRKARHILRPRLTYLTETPKILGFVLCLQGLFMALPLPVPLSNTFAATPVVFLSLGLLFSDGLFILLGYGSSLLAITFFGALFWFGVEGLERISPF